MKENRMKEPRNSSARPDVTGLLVCIALVPSLVSPALAWDAGPSSCKHSECTGGVDKASIPDTQPKYAVSRMPSDNCAAGSELCDARFLTIRLCRISCCDSAFPRERVRSSAE
jgi:hypothetical protein